MLFVTLVLFPLVCLYIFIRALKEDRQREKEFKKFKDDLEKKYPYQHIPGYRQL